MFSMHVSAADVDWQIRFLKEFPDIANQHFKPAMQQAVGALSAEIEPAIPEASGRAANAYKERVTGNGLRLQGRVGWWGANQPWYINVVEHGAKAHDIHSFVPGLKVYIAKHPGIAPRYFMRNAEAKVRQQNDERFEQARDKTVQGLVVR